ncbi:MAG TPA: DUF3014 domain-containing protein [Gammaproteobacteria bacterium]|jgi:hypothetical protein
MSDPMHISPGQDRRPRAERGARLGGLWLILGVIAVGIGAWFWSHREPSAPETVPSAAAPVESLPEAAPPPIRFPVPEIPVAEPEAPVEPLPGLGESDAPIGEALSALVGADALKAFLIPEDVIRRIVATIDNLPREKIATRIRPVPPIAGAFTTAGAEAELILNPVNNARYEAFVRMVQATDTAKLTGVYFHFYPLFQQAYEELGFPGRYFNDRLVEVIDDLLAAPQPAEPIRLVRPGVYYQFADPQLEALSAGQKTLIRMGRENALVIKEKLYELRRAVAGATPEG